MVIIDCQSHLFAPAYAELFTRNPRDPRAYAQGSAYRIVYDQAYQVVVDPARYSPEVKLRDMDEAGIDISVVSMNMPGPEMLADELAVDAARLGNDYLAEVCAGYPGRFFALASVPLQDVAAAIAEAERAVKQLRLCGIVLYPHIGGRPVDGPALEPFYQAVEDLGVPLVLHPTHPAWAPAIDDYSMVPMFGYMVDTSIAMLRLILSGILERHPRLQIVHPHVGGVLPYLMGRVVEQTEVKKRGREHITQAPDTYYSRVYLDTVTPSPLALRYAYDYAGPDRLLFGTDHPWIGMSDGLTLVQAMDISADNKAKILGENAIALFKLN